MVLFSLVKKPTFSNILIILYLIILVGGFFWIVARKSMEARVAIPAHDLGSLIGAIGETRSEVYHEGSVQVNKELWSARSTKPIKSGAMVRVKSREGFILDVEEVEE